MTGGKLPGVSNIVEMIKNSFSKFKRDNRPECAGGNVFSQALSACLAESQFERCAARQPPRFQAAVWLGGHLFVIHWICRRCGGDWSSDLWDGRDKKSATTFFKPGRYNNCTLNSEIKARWRCCLGEMGVETRERAVTGGLWAVQIWKRRPSQK
jgi:hypothetical protein